MNSNNLVSIENQGKQKAKNREKYIMNKENKYIATKDVTNSLFSFHKALCQDKKLYDSGSISMPFMHLISKHK